MFYLKSLPTSTEEAHLMFFLGHYSKRCSGFVNIFGVDDQETKNIAAFGIHT